MSIEIVEQVFEMLKETLESGEKIKIAGFGNFIVRQKSARRGRNPQTNEEMAITARRILTFKPSALLKQTINEKQKLRFKHLIGDYYGNDC
jgi:integration host factor subunit alpha